MIDCLFWRGAISLSLTPPSVSLPDAKSCCLQVCCRTFLIDSSPRLTCCVHICKLLLILLPLWRPGSASAHHPPIKQPLQMLKIRSLHIIEIVWNWNQPSTVHQIKSLPLCGLVAQRWFPLSPVRGVSAVCSCCMRICRVVLFRLLFDHL